MPPVTEVSKYVLQILGHYIFPKGKKGLETTYTVLQSTERIQKIPLNSVMCFSVCPSSQFSCPCTPSLPSSVSSIRLWKICFLD